MAEAVQDGPCGLGPDFCDAGDVVGRVAFEGFDFGDKFRAETVVAVFHTVDVVDPGVSKA